MRPRPVRWIDHREHGERREPMTTALVLAALNMAMNQRKPQDVRHHSAAFGRGKLLAP
jgi:hypothetical protein